jgi:hypothetical protein
LLFLSLFILASLLTGCAYIQHDPKLSLAEDDLSSGKQAGDKLKKQEGVTIYPSVAARRTIAQAMDTIISEKYSEDDASDIRKNLMKIRKDPLMPRDQKVEAGYVIVLFDRIETLRRQNKTLTSQKDKVLIEADALKAENDKLRKDLEELRYKLQKIEEIHIITEKKRGIQ